MYDKILILVYSLNVRVEISIVNSMVLVQKHTSKETSFSNHNLLFRRYLWSRSEEYKMTYLLSEPLDQLNHPSTALTPTPRLRDESRTTTTSWCYLVPLYYLLPQGLPRNVPSSVHHTDVSDHQPPRPSPWYSRVPHYLRGFERRTPPV